jgi:hypothetical protein
MSVGLITLWTWTGSRDPAWGLLVYVATCTWIPGLLILRARLLGREQATRDRSLPGATPRLLALVCAGVVGYGLLKACSIQAFPGTSGFLTAGLMATLCCLASLGSIIFVVARV